jgi:hypothetical protein
LTLVSAPVWADGGGIPDADETIEASKDKSGAAIDLTIERNGADGDGGYLVAAPPDPLEPGTARCYQTADAICIADRAAPTAPPGEPIPTLTDIATFPVTVATAHNQPTGWGVVNRPTNFYADGGTHDVAGVLLGRPATVRFTPVAWHWDYGDDTTTSLAEPRTAWNPQTQFRATATTHVYTKKNDYTVTLFIDYIAQYQYAGQPWRPVAGALRVRANDLQIITWRVKTRLVARDCLEDPQGAGCPGTLRRDDLEN